MLLYLLKLITKNVKCKSVINKLSQKYWPTSFKEEDVGEVVEQDAVGEGGEGVGDNDEICENWSQKLEVAGGDEELGLVAGGVDEGGGEAGAYQLLISLGRHITRSHCKSVNVLAI